MDAQAFLDNFRAIADAPGGVQRLRDLLLELAVSGRLVEQDPADESVGDQVLGSFRARLIDDGVIGKPRHPEGIPVEAPPYEVPNRWRWLRLGDVGAVVGGGTPKSTEPRFWSDEPDIPWVTPADMRSQGKHISRGARDITREGLAESSAQLLPAGTVLFSSRAPIGHVGIAAQPLATNQGFKSCVPYLQEMAQYVYVFLKQVGPSIDAAATGTTFKEVSGKDVALVPIPVPPLAEQQRIVAKVDELMGLCDDLEAHQERRHRATTHFRASALHTLTEAESPDELRNAWERIAMNWPRLTCRADGVTSLRQAILELAVRGRLAGERAPEGHTVRLGDVASLQNGYAFKSEWYTNDGIALVRCQNIGHGELRWTDRRAIAPTRAAEFERFELELNDIVLALDRPLISTGLKVARVQERDLPSLLLQRVARVSPSPAELDADYLWLWLHSPTFIGSIDPGRSNGVPHISTKEVAAIETWLPSIEAQRNTVQRAQDLLRICARLEGSLRRCERSATKLSASAAASLRIAS